MRHGYQLFALDWHSCRYYGAAADQTSVQALAELGAIMEFDSGAGRRKGALFEVGGGEGMLALLGMRGPYRNGQSASSGLGSGVCRGMEYQVDLLLRMETVGPDDRLEEVIRALANAARRGKSATANLVFDTAEAIRIRNDERGEGALQRHISRKIYKIFMPSLLLLHVFFPILRA